MGLTIIIAPLSVPEQPSPRSDIRTGIKSDVLVSVMLRAAQDVNVGAVSREQSAD